MTPIAADDAGPGGGTVRGYRAQSPASCGSIFFGAEDLAAKLFEVSQGMAND
jgi:hypothetical protein